MRPPQDRPRIVLVIPDEWERSLLEHELRAHLLHPIPLGKLGQVLGTARGGHEVDAVVVHASALHGDDDRELRFIRQRHPRAKLALLASPGLEPGWDVVIPRPATTGQVLATLDGIVTGPSARRSA